MVELRYAQDADVRPAPSPNSLPLRRPRRLGYAGQWYLLRVVTESQLQPRDPADVAAQLPHEHFELYPEKAVLGFDRVMGGCGWGRGGAG